MVCPSCHRNSLERRNGLVVFSQQEQNTTDSILLADHGKTVPFLPTHRRTVSPMSDGCTLAPEESQDHLLLPMQLPVQILRYDHFPSGERFSGISIGRYTFSTPVSLNLLSRSAWIFSQIAYPFVFLRRFPTDLRVNIYISQAIFLNTASYINLYNY